MLTMLIMWDPIIPAIWASELQYSLVNAPHPSAHKLNDSLVSEVRLSLRRNLAQRSCCYPFLSNQIPRVFLHANSYSGVICLAYKYAAITAKLIFEHVFTQLL